ncbi:MULTISPECIES: transposase [Caldilinea]|uniref:transposase n=1 Tax=Caldilinea TaxID=233191 RepID=UPI00031A4E2D|nr:MULTISPECIES: transposase [Caldilinea]
MWSGFLVDDRKPVPKLAHQLFGKLFGDKGYLSKALRGVLADPALCGYPADHIHLLHDEGATRQAILDGLAWLAEQAAADPDATAVVFYSGHGWREGARGGIPSSPTTWRRSTCRAVRCRRRTSPPRCAGSRRGGCWS